MKAGIKIKVVDIERYRSEGWIELVVRASNRSSSASQQIYAEKDELMDFANQLKDFPTDINSRIKLEYGGAGERWAGHLALEVYCYEPTGKSAIKVIMETHFVEPHYDRSEFFIICYPVSLNILGESLSEWNPLDGNSFEWEAE